MPEDTKIDPSEPKMTNLTPERSLGASLGTNHASGEEETFIVNCTQTGEICEVLRMYHLYHFFWNPAKYAKAKL